MKAIEPYVEILDELDGESILKKIEECGRLCYKSEGRITNDSAKEFVQKLIQKGHEAMLEHFSFSVKFVTDRSVSHEIVRHRIASFAQESQRYCNYGKTQFDSEVTFIIPHFLNYKSEGWEIWQEQMKAAEAAYFKLLDFGLVPENARTVLPNSTKTEIVMTANLREWRHFLKLRTAMVAHPQMREITRPLLDGLKRIIPVVFDDIEY